MINVPSEIVEVNEQIIFQEFRRRHTFGSTVAMETHYFENIIGALAKDPVWFTVYSVAVIVMASMLVGSRTIVRLTIMLCILPSLRSIRRGDADIFWAR